MLFKNLRANTFKILAANIRKNKVSLKHIIIQVKKNDKIFSINQRTPNL